VISSADGYVRRVRITHKVDYGVRVMVAVELLEREHPGQPVQRSVLAEQEHLPPGFLVDILAALRNGQLLRSHRGGGGGWSLARPADTIAIADVIRVLDGPLASVRGLRPHELAAEGTRPAIVEMWIAVRAALRSVLDQVTVADLANGTLPPEIAALAADPDAWSPHNAARG
jgi:Rrf2 family protein